MSIRQSREHMKLSSKILSKPEQNETILIGNTLENVLRKNLQTQFTIYQADELLN